MKQAMILDFYTIKIIDNHVAKDQILEKKTQGLQFSIHSVTKFNSIHLELSVALTPRGTVYSLVKERVSACSLRGAYSRESKSMCPGKKGGQAGKDGRKEIHGFLRK